MVRATLRKQNKTVLLYCEGDDEVECARYIRSLGIRERNKVVKIKNGHGGSPVETVRKAINEGDGYDEVFVWIDSDRDEFADALVLAESNNILVVRNTPDLEIEILKSHNKNIRSHISSKKQYEACFPGKPLNQIQTYRTLFPTITSLKKMGDSSIRICDVIL